MQRQPVQDSSEQRRRSLHRLPLSIVGSLIAVALAAGSGTAWWAWNVVQPPAPVDLPANSPTDSQANSIAAEPIAPPQIPTTAPEAIALPQPQTTPVQPAVEQTAQIYWLKTVGNQIELAASPVALSNVQQPDQILTAALEKLLAGTSAANVSSDVSSTIPEGTTLRSLQVESDGIHVDLSPTFKSGGGSTSMVGRVAQVLYTATTLNPNAKVWLSVNGEPLEVLGGEGLELEQPMTRQSFDENFSL